MQQLNILRLAAAFLLAVYWASPAAASAPALTPWFFDDFDVDNSAGWVVNEGPTDNHADFFFDYSIVGIPPAPRSVDGTTRGLKLQANLFSGIFGGFSVSPAVSPIPDDYAGNYTLKVDWWSNYIGSDTTGVGSDGVAAGGIGAATLSTFGILTSGVVPNFPGSADSVFFAATGNGGSAADYRAYSSERAVSYQLPPISPEDAHATYVAGSRNSNDPYYVANFPGGLSPPPLQQALFPFTQSGSTPAGTMGFAWHEVTVAKRGDLVTWMIDGVPLAIVDVSNLSVPTAGTNILIGYSDVNAGIGPDPDFASLQFGLFDNVRVVPEPASAALAFLALAVRCKRRSPCGK
jgi:hypothetical protein